MSDPLLDSVAAALAGQAVTALSAAGKKALNAIRDLVRRKSEDDEEMRAALTAAEDRDAGEPEIKALAERLDREAANDAELAELLRSAGTTVHQEVTDNSKSGDNRVSNEFSGTAKNVIQAGDIHGGLTLN